MTDTISAKPNSSAPTVSIEQQLATVAAFKFWRLNRPNAAKLLKEVVFRWRGASAFIRGKPGKWVVWPRERWAEWTGLSRNQLDRALRELEECGLIERERHRFAGREVRVFLRPTALALNYLEKPTSAKPQKENSTSQPKHTGTLAQQTPKHTLEKATANTDAGIHERADEKIGEKSDYTSFPFSSKETTELISSQNIDASKGSAGNDKDDAKVLQWFEKKNAKIDDQYPKIKGYHEKKVRHPSLLHANWYSFSTKVQSELYKKYLLYIDNFKKGKQGKHSAHWDDWTEEDDAALLAWGEKKKAAKAQT